MFRGRHPARCVPHHAPHPNRSRGSRKRYRRFRRGVVRRGAFDSARRATRIVRVAFRPAAGAARHGGVPCPGTTTSTGPGPPCGCTGGGPHRGEPALAQVAFAWWASAHRLRAMTPWRHCGRPIGPGIVADAVHRFALLFDAHGPRHRTGGPTAGVRRRCHPATASTAAADNGTAADDTAPATDVRSADMRTRNSRQPMAGGYPAGPGRTVCECQGCHFSRQRRPGPGLARLAAFPQTVSVTWSR